MTRRHCRYVAWTVCALMLSLSPLAAQEEDYQPSPLDEIATRMSVVVRDLSRQSTGKPTQTRQQTVKQKLDDLIAELEKECENCRGGASGANPTRPLNAAAIVGGPGGIGDLRSPRDSNKKWGELPPHERDRILQSMTEGFPASYQRVLERYYRQLAEEKPVGEARGESDQPAAAGAGNSDDTDARPDTQPASAKDQAPTGEGGK